MRIRTWTIGLAILGCTALAGCGGGAASSDDAGAVDDYTPPPPEPGTCRALCCADTDCNAGETCMAFDPNDGTIGVCTGGSGDDGGIAGDGGTPVFGSSCWTLSQPQCNPFTNEGCQNGDACDVGALNTDTVPEVACYSGDNVQGPGETCDSVDGPFCIPGYHCVKN